MANLEVQRVESSDRWEIEYVDDSLYPQGPDKQVIDVYALDRSSGTVRLLMHYHETE